MVRLYSQVRRSLKEIIHIILHNLIIHTNKLTILYHSNTLSIKMIHQSHKHRLLQLYVCNVFPISTLYACGTKYWVSELYYQTIPHRHSSSLCRRHETSIFNFLMQYYMLFYVVQLRSVLLVD
jgi:hypothetical protein